ncbi:MAG: BACON domain-containing protein [Bacteroidales bacterium]|nr:BACON domain-containing protein [Bacteroidales bacterium]
MKRLLHFLLAIFFLVIPFAACDEVTEQEDTATLSVTTAIIPVAATDTKATFDIKSNSAWHVICRSERVTAYTGSGHGDGILEVTFEENTDTEEEQSISLAVIAGKKSIALEIIQARKGNVLEDPTLSFTATGQVTAEDTVYKLSIQSNVIWGVYTEDAWIKSYTQMGEGDGELVIEFEKYKKRKADRTATFVISAQSITKNFTLTQLRTDKVEIVDSKIAPFLAEEVDEDVAYRLTGRISAANGSSVTIDDYSGSVSASGVLASAGGAPIDFAAAGLAVGDIVTLVGTRAVSGTDPVIGEAYLESSHKIEAVTVSEFLAKADGNDTWYQISGLVTEITDMMNGALTMTDQLDNTASLTVSSVLTGVNGESAKFESLFVAAENVLTVIACGKNGTTVSNAWFVSKKSGGYPVGILAQWSFKEDYADLATHWSTGVLDNSASVTLTDLIGDTGHYIESLDKKSKMKFTQVDKKAVGKWAKLYLYSTCQPGFTEIWVGDAFEFDVDNEFDVPVGTKIKMSFCLRIPTASLGCYMLEYFAEDAWHPVEDEDNPVKEVTVSETKYEYNIQRTGNNAQTLQVYNFAIKHEIPAGGLKIRIRAAAPYTSGGADMTTPNGAARMRGVVSGEDLSPVIEVVK